MTSKVLVSMNNNIELHVAAITGDVGALRLLLSNHVDVNIKNKHGYTALHYAAINGHIEATRILVENGADISARTNSNYTALDLTLHEDIIDLLEEYENAEDIKEPEYM